MVHFQIEKVKNSIQRIYDSSQLAPFLGGNYYYVPFWHYAFT